MKRHPETYLDNAGSIIVRIYRPEVSRYHDPEAENENTASAIRQAVAAAVAALLPEGWKADVDAEVIE